MSDNFRNNIFEDQYATKGKARLDKGHWLYRIMKPLEDYRLDVISALIKDSNLDVLEVGCGDGSFLWNNREKWKSVTGIDIVADQIKKAKKYNFPCPSKFIIFDPGHKPLPFKNSSFDLVVVISTLQFIYDLDLFIRESYRVLKKGGCLIVQVPNFSVFFRRVMVFFGKFPHTTSYRNNWDGGTIHYFTKDDLNGFLRKRGFKVKNITCSGILAKIRRWWVSFLGADLIFVCYK